MPEENNDLLPIPVMESKHEPLPFQIYGDERRFKQVLINLIKNAFKFTPSGGMIKVKMSYNNDFESLIVHVQDTGVGITKEDMQKLFSRFGKLHRTAELNHEGIGMGLSIVKQIVEASQGSYSVHSAGLGKGSQFAFTMKMPIIQKKNKSRA